MSVSEQNEGRTTVGRRARTLLLATTAPTGELAACVTMLAADLKATIQLVTTAEAASVALENSFDAITLAVIEDQLADSLALARRVAEHSPLTEIVIVSPEKDISLLRARIGPAPRLGSHWSIVAIDAMSNTRLLRVAFQRADQRKATRTTLDRFNARLSVPAPSVDAGQMRELVISDRFLSSILESNFDAVLIVDTAGRVTTLNPAAEALFNKKANQLVSQAVGDLAGGPWREDIRALLDHRREGASIQTAMDLAETTKHLEISATPVFDKAHNLLATSLIVRDVTNRIQSEEALRTTEKLAAVGRLASTIAHEINNPLESLTNILYIARSQTTDPDLIHWLDLADQELRRVSIITNQTLLFHKQARTATDTAMSELLKGVLTMFQGRIIKGHVEVVERYRGKDFVEVLHGEIRQVVANLVGNAIDAMSTGGRLYIRCQNGTDWKTMRRGIKVVVADTGHGMPAKTLSKVFEPFYTTKDANGAGVGLWLSRDIVVRHEGRLSLRSSQLPGHRGTVFVMFLPHAEHRTGRHISQ